MSSNTVRARIQSLAPGNALDSPPRRSSQIIGWKAMNTEVDGEKYGPYELSKPRTSAHKVFGWPIEAER